jgi:regulator of protease activity HflC (stomatin/prohibitin superfamily)
MEDTPAYIALRDAGLLNTEFRKSTFEDIFGGIDLRANSSKKNDCCEKAKFCYCVPILGCILYHSTHIEMFVPAGHVGLLMDDKKNYLFAQPGMHNIFTPFLTFQGVHKLPTNDVIQHGNRSILVVEQGYVGYAVDNGQPVLFPPGMHVWTSETLQYQEQISLDKHNIILGPYTLLTVDEGYAAVTQNNGKQQILPGGFTHLLNHKNWRFEKFLTLKIQTDDLQKIQATSADNITMSVTSTVCWRIRDPMLAATMAAETMAVGAGGDKVSSDITKLRQDVLKQAIASLASFIGGVNYSDSFHMAAKAQTGDGSHVSEKQEPESEAVSGTQDNPLYDTKRMSSAVKDANETTRTYGVEIMTINILSAVPVDNELTKALAAGAVASAQALQAETAARGNARAMRIDAEAEAGKARIEAEGKAQAMLIQAQSEADAARTIAEGNKQAGDLLSTSQVAVDLAKMDKSATMLNPQDKFFFGQEPEYLANLVLKGQGHGGTGGADASKASKKGSIWG